MGCLPLMHFPLTVERMPERRVGTTITYAGELQSGLFQCPTFFFMFFIDSFHAVV